MRFIQGEMRRMRKSSEYFHKGFVSAWFLSVLLSGTMILSVVALNDQARLQTVMNMKKNSVYFQQEAAVMADIHCHLVNGSLEEGAYQTAGYSYHLDVRKDHIYAEITSGYPETLDIVYDPEIRTFVSMSPFRPDSN